MSEVKDSKRKRPAETRTTAIEPKPLPIEKITAVTTLPQPVHRSPRSASEQLLDSYRGSLASISESHQAMANSATALLLEMTGLAQSTLTEAGDCATALIRAGSFADAIEIQLGYARRSFASLMAGSTRLSEINARLVSEVSRPIVAPFSGSVRTG